MGFRERWTKEFKKMLSDEEKKLAWIAANDISKPGIGFGSVGVKDLVDNVTFGIALGLLIGKQIGIFSFSLLAIVLKFGKLPDGLHLGHLYGISLLGGIGFTMSLFIGSLAFECSGDPCINMTDERIGILLGSLLSGVAGYFVLKRLFPKEQ